MRNLKRNYIYNLIYQLLSIITPFVTTPYVSRVLGAANIGEYSYGLSIATYFAIFGSLGITTYAQIEIAKNQDSNKEKSRLITELLFLKTIILTLFIFLYLLIAFNSALHKGILITLVIYLLAQLSDISWILQGLEEFKKLAIRNIFIKFVSILLIFILVKNNSDVYVYVLIMQGSVFLGNFLLWPYISKYIDLKNISIKNSGKHIKNSIIYFIPTIATTVYTVVDKSMIGWITNSNLQNGYYEQAHKIEQILLVLLVSIGTITLPRIAFLNNKKNQKTMQAIINKSIVIILLMSIPMCLGLIGISDNLIPVFLGNDYDECIGLTKIFSFLLIIVGLDNVIGRQCLMATGNQKKFNIGVIVGAVLNLFMNLLLIPNFGAIGAAISSVCAELVILIQFCIFSRKYLKVDIKSSIFKYVFASILMYFVVVLFKDFSRNLILNMSFQILCGMFTYLITLILLKEKYILNILRGIFKGVRMIIYEK